MVTNVLIAVNVIVFVAELSSGSSFGSIGGSLIARGALYGPAVADGDWYRLITAAFLHGGFIHILFNMFMLWWFGRRLEYLLGPGRYIGIYLVSALAGSAGSLIIAPDSVTVGASGAVFGILGAGLVLERSQIFVFGGQALFVIAINLVLSFTLSGISVGGHVGGLIGGALSMLALNRFGRHRPLLSREGAKAIAALVVLAIASIAIAYASVRGLT
jgi:membrane associated rhomboid family serine protease